MCCSCGEPRRDIAGLPAPDIARLGIGYVPQGRGRFAGMTVAENLALADRVFALERGAVFHQGPAAPRLADLDYRKRILWL